jgi:phosphate transport system substrate-binding protein
VGKQPTHSGWRRPAGLGLFVLAAACTVDPDPDEVCRELRLSAVEVPRGDEVLPAPAVALDGDFAAAAPLGEVAGREEVLARRTLDIALGGDAADMFDAALSASLAERHPDLHGAFHGSTERQAVELVLAGHAQCALLRGGLSARDVRAGLRQTQVGVELFALAVTSDFPAQSLSRTQMRQVLTGSVTQWSQVGIDAGPITVAVPADRRIAERAASRLIPGDTFGAEAVQTVDEDDLAQRLRHRGTIGVVRATVRQPAGLRLLSVDWSPPTAAAHANGNYPYAIPVHLVTPGQPTGRALEFLQYLQSPAGRDLLGRTLLLP